MGCWKTHVPQKPGTIALAEEDLNGINEDKGGKPYQRTHMCWKYKAKEPVAETRGVCCKT